jgi:hypothetical protein
MHARALHCLIAAAALFTFLPAGAETADAQTVDGGCALPAADKDPLADRAGILGEYERLPQQCLQQIVRACSAASTRALLDFGSAAICSFGYEALLRQQFGGNFPALLAWWRSQPTEDVQ